MTHWTLSNLHHAAAALTVFARGFGADRHASMRHYRGCRTQHPHMVGKARSAAAGMAFPVRAIGDAIKAGAFRAISAGAVWGGRLAGLQARQAEWPGVKAWSPPALPANGNPVDGAAATLAGVSLSGGFRHTPPQGSQAAHVVAEYAFRGEYKAMAR